MSEEEYTIAELLEQNMRKLLKNMSIENYGTQNTSQMAEEIMCLAEMVGIYEQLKEIEDDG